MGYDASPRERILPLVWMATFLRAHLHWARSMVSRSGMSDPLGLSTNCARFMTIHTFLQG
jgi:hypothetical protein